MPMLVSKKENMTEGPPGPTHVGECMLFVLFVCNLGGIDSKQNKSRRERER